MDIRKILEIKELAKKAHRSSEHFKMLGMMNTATDPEEKERQAVEYAVVQAEASDTRRDLHQLIAGGKRDG